MRLYAAYWARLRALPGARDLLRRCHEAGLTTVLASSAAEVELAVLQQGAGLRRRHRCDHQFG